MEPDAIKHAATAETANATEYAATAETADATEYAAAARWTNAAEYADAAGQTDATKHADAAETADANEYAATTGKMPRPELSPEDKKQADKLCIISMILMFAPMAVIFIKNIILGLLFDAGKEEFYYNIASSYVLGSILTFLMAGCGIAALVLMILVRVKYPQSVFGKVLMWLYIALAILVVVFIAVTIIACGLAFISCVRNCPG